MLHKQAGDAIQYFFILLFVANISALSHRKKHVNLLSRIIQHSARLNEPILIILESENQRTADSLDLVNKKDSTFLTNVHQYLHQRQDKNGEYLLERLLRTRNDDSSLENVKSALRALQRRCKQVTTCKKKCPKKKPSCPVNCQQVFDNLNLCDPPPPPKKKCKKPKCGKTMPPSWRMLL